MWVILRKLCQNCPKDKHNTGLFRVLNLCSTRFVKQTFGVCMLQHAGGTGRPEKRN